MKPALPIIPQNMSGRRHIDATKFWNCGDQPCVLMNMVIG